MMNQDDSALAQSAAAAPRHIDPVAPSSDSAPFGKDVFRHLSGGMSGGLSDLREESGQIGGMNEQTRGSLSVTTPPSDVAVAPAKAAIGAPGAVGAPTAVNNNSSGSDGSDDGDEVAGPRPCRHNKWTLAGSNGLLCIVCKQVWLVTNPLANSCPDYELHQACCLTVHCPYEHICRSLPTKKKKKKVLELSAVPGPAVSSVTGAVVDPLVTVPLMDGNDSDLERDYFFHAVAVEVLKGAEAAAKAELQAQQQQGADDTCDGEEAPQPPRIPPSQIELEIHRQHLRRLHLRGQSARRMQQMFGTTQDPALVPAAGALGPKKKAVQPPGAASALPGKAMAPLGFKSKVKGPSPLDAPYTQDYAGHRLHLPNPAAMPWQHQPLPNDMRMEQMYLQQQLSQMSGRPRGYMNQVPFPAPASNLLPPPRPAVSLTGRLGGVALPGFHPSVGSIIAPPAMGGGLPPPAYGATGVVGGPGSSGGPPGLGGAPIGGAAAAGTGSAVSMPPWLEFYQSGNQQQQQAQQQGQQEQTQIVLITPDQYWAGSGLSS